MKKYIALFIMILNSILFAVDYMTIDEFTSLHPQEYAKMKLFNDIVQKEPHIISIEQKNPVKITIIYPSGEISDYWKRSKLSFEKRLKLLNIKYEIDENLINSSNVIAQNKKIKEALTKQSDYLIFTLDVNAHKKFIAQLLSRHKPKLILQNITTPLKEWEGNQPFFYVGFDHIKGTKLIANYFKNKFKDGARYSMLYFRKGYISKMRGDGFINILNKEKIFKLTDSFYTDGDSEKSFNATKAILKQTKDIDFIYSCSTDISVGAVKTVSNLKNPPLINGWGGGSVELELIKEKKLEVTVMRMNDDNGIAMGEAIKLDLEKNYHQLPKIYSGEFILIDKSTSLEKIETYKKRAFRYSN